MIDKTIHLFSEHLFWDVNRDDLDIENDKYYIIAQVLEYGKFEDWRILRNYYGISKIAETAMKFRVLDKKALAFISVLSGIPKEKFRCYKEQQLNPKHWNF
ncbi:MAG TPA: hypothetical protein ENK75_05290 [Saprospiraceae bacterium]|nr:hypothetical protein [Saprospiraceae bacterium]